MEDNSNMKNDNGAKLLIEDSLTIYDVGVLREKALEALNSSDLIELNLDTVNECDTAGVQMLYSLRKSADESGKKLHILNLSQSVEEAFRRAEMPLDMVIR